MIDNEVGIKHDQGKTRWSLMPLEALDTIAQLYTRGAEKNGDNNWQKLTNLELRAYDAMQRHLKTYFIDKEKFDKEFDLPHLAHMCFWSIAMLWNFLNNEKNAINKPESSDSI